MQSFLYCILFPHFKGFVSCKILRNNHGRGWKEADKWYFVQGMLVFNQISMVKFPWHNAAESILLLSALDVMLVCRIVFLQSWCRYFIHLGGKNQFRTNNELFSLDHFSFLICYILLAALHLETGKRSVMHLVARENLPEPATQGTDIV